MTIRPNVELRADFPDDCVEDDHDILQFPGANIAEALKVALSEIGYSVSEPIYAGEHGWELDVVRARRRFWIQITRLEDDECLLMTRNMGSWLRPDLPAYRTFLTDLQRILEGDRRFSRIGWLPKDWSRNNAPASAGPFED